MKITIYEKYSYVRSFKFYKPDNNEEAIFALIDKEVMAEFEQLKAAGYKECSYNSIYSPDLYYSSKEYQFNYLREKIIIIDDNPFNLNMEYADE